MRAVEILGVNTYESRLRLLRGLAYSAKVFAQSSGPPAPAASPLGS
jgi:hypothetical protein